MFTKERFMTISNQMGSHNYVELVELIEQRHFTLEQVFTGALRQIDMCEDIIRSGIPQVVRTEGGTETINSINAVDYLNQGYFSLVAIIVYARLHNMSSFLNTVDASLLREIDQEVLDVFMLNAGLTKKDKPEDNKKVKVILKGW